MKETQKLSLRRYLMLSFIIGSLALGALLVLWAIYIGYDTYVFYLESDIFAKGMLAMIPSMILMGLAIPGFVVPLAKRALISIKEEKEILSIQGQKELEDFRKSHQNIYPKKFGLNK